MSIIETLKPLWFALPIIGPATDLGNAVYDYRTGHDGLDKAVAAFATGSSNAGLSTEIKESKRDSLHPRISLGFVSLVSTVAFLYGFGFLSAAFSLASFAGYATIGLHCVSILVRIKECFHYASLESQLRVKTAPQPAP